MSVSMRRERRSEYCFGLSDMGALFLKRNGLTWAPSSPQPEFPRWRGNRRACAAARGRGGLRCLARTLRAKTYVNGQGRYSDPDESRRSAVAPERCQTTYAGRYYGSRSERERWPTCARRGGAGLRAGTIMGRVPFAVWTAVETPLYVFVQARTRRFIATARLGCCMEADTHSGTTSGQRTHSAQSGLRAALRCC
jgi:hypothetical protein